MATDDDQNGDGEETGERLRDRATSAFQQRREQVQEGSERLADRATSTFQRRRQQAERAREAVDERRSEFADALDVDAELVEPIQLDDRGEEIGFVPDDPAQDILGERFADERPFVEAEDALVDADPREGVETMTDPAARDRIGERAEAETAAEVDFIGSADLDAEVGAGGVEDVRTRPDRRDDIGQRVATDLAGDDPFAEPGDFGVDVGPRGVEDAGLTDTGAQRRAGRQFEAETPLEEVDPTADIRPADDDGFALTERGDRRLAARQFESQTDAFGTGDLDPQTDIRDTNGGFGLARDPARQAAARDIDQQIDEIDVGPDDIDLRLTDDGFEAEFEREVRR